jgi:Holliday junction DNA helicase RuvA
VISRLRGVPVGRTPDGLVLDVGGVGYLVAATPSAIRKADGAREVVVETYLHVREDTLQLFGFATDTEELLFKRLIEVSGVGPKVAISILSGIEAPELVEALRRGDVARLVRVPGVGRKTAERLVLELKDKMPALPAPGAAPSPPPPASLGDDLVSALANLGYSRPEAEKGVARALAEDPDARFEDLLRRALRVLSGR